MDYSARKLRPQLREAIVALAAAMLAGCGGGGDEDPPPPAAAAAPTVTISSSKSSVRVGETLTITWSSTNATACTATGAWSGAKATSGSSALTASQAGTQSYQLSCTGTGGTGQATATVAVASATTSVTVPGLPVSVPISSGTCAPTSNADFQISCLTSLASIPTKYATFTGDVGGRVRKVGDATPTVDSATSCAAGYNSAAGQFQVSTSIGNDILSATGATVAEVVYTPAFIASAGLTGVTGLSALVAVDSGNSDHVHMVLYETTSAGPLKLASGGTVAISSTPQRLDVFQCMTTAQTTPPPPPPAALSCPERQGSGSQGLGFASQRLEYLIDDTSAGRNTTTTLKWGVSYRNDAISNSSYTGSLRVSLWAVPFDFSGSGTLNGTRIAVASPNFTGNGAKSANQLYNHYDVTGITSQVTGRNPSAGAYCMVLVLDEYFSDTTCTSNDHYCYVDWIQFGGTETFR